MRIVLLGPPGSGKGVQCRKLNERYRIPVISTISLLREAGQDGTVTGKEVQAYLDLRQQVPDEVVCQVLKERLGRMGEQDGFLLVGFPRTAAQGAGLDEMLDVLGRPLDLVLLLQGDHDYFMERLEGRQFCQSCGAVYNIFSNPTRVEGGCDRCGGRVRKRADDNEETISNRMRIYEQQSASLIQYYSLQGKIRPVSAQGDPEAVLASLCKAIYCQDHGVH